MIYIALLRGINVSGQKMIKMTDLMKICDSLGFQSYINLFAERKYRL